MVLFGIVEFRDSHVAFLSTTTVVDVHQCLDSHHHDLCRAVRAHGLQEPDCADVAAKLASLRDRLRRVARRLVHLVSASGGTVLSLVR